jgi:hypothetical protein
VEKKAYYEVLPRASYLEGFFGTTKAKENRHEIWRTECKEFLHRAGSLITAARKITRYKYVQWAYTRSDEAGTELNQQAIIHFYRKRMRVRKSY